MPIDTGLQVLVTVHTLGMLNYHMALQHSQVGVRVLMVTNMPNFRNKNILEEPTLLFPLQLTHEPVGARLTICRMFFFVLL